MKRLASGWGLWSRTSTASVDVRSLVLTELHKVSQVEQREKLLFESKVFSQKKKVARLLHLFQCDLLPGISGQILSSKMSYDQGSAQSAVSGRWKMCCWSIVALGNASMLFYILLFSLRQSKYRQSAWLQSFLLWMLTEIFFVSTITVLVMHHFLPAVIMRDIYKLKDRMTELIHDYKHSLTTCNASDESAHPRFNAAKYLFVSTKLAPLLPESAVAKMIARFATPWPRQSYRHVFDASKAYNKGVMNGIGSFGGVMLLFLLGSFMSLPQGMRDGLIHVSATVSVGYAVLIHTQLFHVFPVLAFLPLFVVCVVAHFVVRSLRANPSSPQDNASVDAGRKILPYPVDNIDKNGGRAAMEVDGDVNGNIYRNRRSSIIDGVNLIQMLRSEVGGEEEEEEKESGDYLTAQSFHTNNRQKRTNDHSSVEGIEIEYDCSELSSEISGSIENEPQSNSLLSHWDISFEYDQQGEPFDERERDAAREGDGDANSFKSVSEFDDDCSMYFESEKQ